MSGSRSALWPYLLLPAFYLLLVAAGPLFSWYTEVQHGDAPDANIGYGLGFMWTAGLGMPWSLWPWNDPPASDVAEMSAYVGCGLVNVGLIAALVFWFWSRSNRGSDRR